MHQVIFMLAARLEMIEAQDWYEREAPGLGARFREEVDFQVNRIAANPLHFPEIVADVRCAQLSRCSFQTLDPSRNHEQTTA